MVDGTTTNAVLLYIVAVFVHGRVDRWVTCRWMGWWVVLYLRAQPGGWMGGVGLVHGRVSECVSSVSVWV